MGECRSCSWLNSKGGHGGYSGTESAVSSSILESDLGEYPELGEGVRAGAEPGAIKNNAIVR